LAAQNKDAELKKIFTPIAAALTENETKIVAEYTAVQGRSVEVGGYFMPDDAKASEVMRPSRTFNEILASI
jgi:isocitrate dehydrogenase